MLEGTFIRFLCFKAIDFSYHILNCSILFVTMLFCSLVGMILMFTGLYFVLWAKGKEGYVNGCGLESAYDAEKPLLN